MLLLSQLSQRCRNRLGPASAYATAKPRAPVGTEAHAVDANRDFDCALPPLTKRQFICVAPRRGPHRGNQVPRWTGRESPIVALNASLATGKPGCLGTARCTRVSISFANARTKMPPAWCPRAFAVPRKIGVTDLPEGSRSGVGGESFVCKRHAQARIALGQRWRLAIGDVVRVRHD